MGHVEGFRKVGRKARHNRKRKPEPHTANRGTRKRQFGGTKEKLADVRRRDEKRRRRDEKRLDGLEA